MATIKKAQFGSKLPKSNGSEGTFKKGSTGKPNSSPTPALKPKKKGRLREFLTADPSPTSGRVNKVYKNGGDVACKGKKISKRK